MRECSSIQLRNSDLDGCLGNARGGDPSPQARITYCQINGQQVDQWNPLLGWEVGKQERIGCDEFGPG